MICNIGAFKWISCMTLCGINAKEKKTKFKHIHVLWDTLDDLFVH